MKTEQPTSGFTLKYEGATFTRQGIVYPESTPLPEVLDASTPTAKFIKDFSNLGALVIRYHLGQGQRSGLISQVTRSDYQDNPVEKPAHGEDEDGLFEAMPQSPKHEHQSVALEEMNSWPLGKNKVLNERAQPLIHINRTNSGEQALWAHIHSGVWGVGINLRFELKKQGFTYIFCPADFTAEEYDRVSTLLRSGQFTINNDLILVGGHQLKTSQFNKDEMPIDLQDQEPLTFQENGLLITDTAVSDKPSALGWMVHLPTQKVLEQADCEDLIRIIRLSGGGFYELTEVQKRYLQSGRLKNNGLGLFTQNQAFNALFSIVLHLEKEFGFNPAVLLDNATKTVYSSVKRAFETTDLLDDFLTGALLTEMEQHLMVTRATSERTELPLRFTNPFYVTTNNTKAIAHAFNVKDGEGKPVLTADALYHDERLLDVGVSGQLLMPSLTDSQHSAALLATSILVAEQMVLEQLVRAACKDSNHPYAQALKAILVQALGDEAQAEAAYQQFIGFALACPSNEHGPILGLQYPHCETLIMVMREVLNTGYLIKLAESLNTPQYCTLDTVLKSLPKHAVDNYADYLAALHFICEQLQKLDGISAAPVESRGAVVGTALLLTTLFPHKAAELGVTLSQAPAVAQARSADSDEAPAAAPLMACPFMQTKLRKRPLVAIPADAAQAAPVVSTPVVTTPVVTPVATNRHSFFSSAKNVAKVAVPLVVAAGIAVYSAM